MVNNYVLTFICNIYIYIFRYFLNLFLKFLQEFKINFVGSLKKLFFQFLLQIISKIIVYFLYYDLNPF